MDILKTILDLMSSGGIGQRWVKISLATGCSGYNQ